MTVEESSFEDDLSRSCLTLSAHMERCFRETYGKLGHRLVGPLDPNKFDNAASKVQETGLRTLLALGLALSTALAGLYIGLSVVILTAGSKLLRATGFYLQKDHFTHIPGKAPEADLGLKEFTVMTWDAGDQKSYPDGLNPWSARSKEFISTIQKADPTVLVLRGMYDAANVENLIKQLGDRYAHFYTHFDGAGWRETDGCLIATKCAVANFSYIDPTSNTRGFSSLELKASPNDTAPSIRIIGTQFQAGMDAKPNRLEQMNQIVDHLRAKTYPLPTFFVGNAEENLSHLLHHSYQGDEPTHSDELAKQWGSIVREAKASKNLISLFKYRIPGGTLPVLENKLHCRDSVPIRGFDKDFNTRTAIADNHAVLTTLQFKKS